MKHQQTVTAQEQQKTGPLLLQSQHNHALNLQLCIPQQMVVHGQTDDDEGEWAAPLLPAVQLARHFQPRNRLLAIIISPADTPKSNPALDAAMRTDPHFTRSGTTPTAMHDTAAVNMVCP
jgi:hypothetical protein